MKLLGIDVGTGGTPAVLLERSGRVIGSATAEHTPMSSLRIGWAEQEPDDWWRAACRAIPECLAKSKTDPSEIGGIGLTGQMHGPVLLDENGNVLRHSIIWCDQRTAEECREITQLAGAERLIEWTAKPALTGFTLPKIWWGGRPEPESWR